MSKADTSLPIDHVVDGLYIGGYAALRHADQLRAANITHVLKLYEGLPRLPADFVTLENPIADDRPIPPTSLRAGLEFMRVHLAAKQRVLVLCSSGASRSAAFVIAYLLEGGADLRLAYMQVVRAHPDTELSVPVWQSLLTIYGAPYSLIDVERWAAGIDR